MSLLQLQDTVEAAYRDRNGETIRLRMALTEALCQVSRSAAFDLGNQAARAATSRMHAPPPDADAAPAGRLL